MSSKSSPISPPKNLTLDEALARARQNQRRFWIIFLLWGVAAAVAMSKFYQVTRTVDQLRQALDLSIQVNEETSVRLKQDVQEVGQRRDEIKKEIDGKLAELQDALNRSHTELKSFDVQKDRKISELSGLLEKAKHDIMEEKKLLDALSAKGEDQQRALAALKDELTAMKADLRQATAEVQQQVGHLSNKLAEQTAQQAGRISADIRASGSDLQARALAVEALDLLENGQTAQAIAKLDQAVEASTEQTLRAGALALRGAAKNAIGLENSALGDVNAALQVEPDNIEYLILRSNIHHDLGQHDEARADLEAVLRRVPRQARALEMLGHLHLKHHPDQVAAAVTRLTQALEVEPASLNARGERGLAYILAGRPAEAAQDLAETLRQGGDNQQARARTLESQALLALNQGQPEQARALALQADQIEPERLWTTFILAATMRDTAPAARKAPQPEADKYARAFAERAGRSKANVENVRYLRRFLPPEYQRRLDQLAQPPQAAR